MWTVCSEFFPFSNLFFKENLVFSECALFLFFFFNVRLLVPFAENKDSPAFSVLGYEVIARANWK